MRVLAIRKGNGAVELQLSDSQDLWTSICSLNGLTGEELLGTSIKDLLARTTFADEAILQCGSKISLDLSFLRRRVAVLAALSSIMALASCTGLSDNQIRVCFFSNVHN